MINNTHIKNILRFFANFAGAVFSSIGVLYLLRNFIYLNKDTTIIILMISIIIFYYFLNKDNKNEYFLYKDKIEDNIILFIFALIGIIIFITLPIFLAKTYAQNKYATGVCNNYEEGIFFPYINYKICISPDKEIIINKSSSESVDMLFRVPLNFKKEINATFLKTKILNYFLQLNELSPEIKEQFKKIKIEQKNPQYFSNNRKIYKFLHFVFDFNQKITDKDFKEVMLILYKFWFGNKYSYPDKRIIPWIPDEKVIYDFTTDIWYANVNNIYLKLNNGKLYIYDKSKQPLKNNKTVIDIKKYLSKNQQVFLEKEKDTQLIYNVKLINNPKQFLYNLIDSLIGGVTIAGGD